jgi:hypothetical protein
MSASGGKDTRRVLLRETAVQRIVRQQCFFIAVVVLNSWLLSVQ